MVLAKKYKDCISPKAIQDHVPTENTASSLTHCRIWKLYSGLRRQVWLVNSLVLAVLQPDWRQKVKSTISSKNKTKGWEKWKVTTENKQNVRIQQNLMMITLFLICNSGASTRITQLYASTRKPEVITPAGFTGKAVTCHHEPAVNEYEYEFKKKKFYRTKILIQ